MADLNEKESIVIKDESSPLGCFLDFNLNLFLILICSQTNLISIKFTGIFLVKSGSKGDRLLFRYPYELNDQTDDKYEIKPLTTSSYDSGDSSSKRPTSSVCSSIISSNSNLNSCLPTQFEKKKNPYALVEENNGSLFNYNLGFNSTNANTTAVKTPTATFSNELNPFYKFNSTQLSNKNQNLHHKLTNQPFNNKIDSCLLNVINLPDKILCDLLAVKSDLCGNKFELKINDVRFVAHPVLLSSKNNFQSSNENNKSGTNSILNKGWLLNLKFNLLLF